MAEVVRELEAARPPATRTGRSLERGAARSPRRRAARSLTALYDLRAAGGYRARRQRASRRYARCNATLVAGEPAAVAADAERWAAAGFTHLQAEARARATTSARCGRCGRRSTRWRGSGSTPTAPGASRRRSGSWRRSSRSTSSWSSSRWRRWWSWRSSRRRPRSRSPPTRASRPRPTPNGRASSGACSIVGVKLSKVGGVGAGDEIAAVLPTYLSSALDGPVGIAAAVELAARGEVHRPFDEPLAHGLATQRLFAATIAAVECQLFDDILQMPRGPGTGRRDRRGCPERAPALASMALLFDP